MNPLTPVSGAEAGGAGLAALWQQVAAAAAQPMAGAEAGPPAAGAGGAAVGVDAEAPSGPGAAGALAAGASSARAMPAAAGALVAGGAATAAAVAGQSPAASLRDRLSPAPHASALAAQRAEARDGSTAGASLSNLAAPHAAASAAPATTATVPLQVPVSVSSLFALPPDMLRRHDLPKEEPAAPRRRRLQREADEHEGEQQDDASDTPAEPALRFESEDAVLPDAAPEDDALANTPHTPLTLADCRDLLSYAGQHEALRELALHRHVLLLRAPPAGLHAEAFTTDAWLIGGPRATIARFPARWWPAAGLALPAQWRLHRDDSGAQAGLRSRIAPRGHEPDAPRAIACRLLLDTWPRLPDPGCALLSLQQPRHFGRSLGAQWSLLFVVLPAEAD